MEWFLLIVFVPWIRRLLCSAVKTSNVPTVEEWSMNLKLLSHGITLLDAHAKYV